MKHYYVIVATTGRRNCSYNYQLLYTFLSLFQLLTGHGSNGKLRDDEIMTMEEIRGGKSEEFWVSVWTRSLLAEIKKCNNVFTSLEIQDCSKDVKTHKLWRQRVNELKLARYISFLLFLFSKPPCLGQRKATATVYNPHTQVCCDGRVSPWKPWIDQVMY